MIFLLLIAGIAQAQTPDTEVLKKIDEKFLPPPTIGEREATIKPLRWKIPAPTTMEDILRSPIVQKALKRKGHIQDLATENLLALSANVIVNVHAQTDDYGFFYIVDKNGGITRRVHMNYAVGFKNDVAMYEEPRHYHPVIEHKNVSPYDRSLQWKPEVSMLLGRTSAGWTADILDDAQARTATGYQFGGRWLADLPGKFQLGPSAQFSGSQHSLRAGDATYRNYSLGVAAKTRNYEWGGFPWRLYGEFLWGPWGVIALQTPAGQSDIELRSTSLVIGWERPYQNSLGEWSWGISWQRDWPKLRNQTIFIRQDSSSNTNDIIGLHLTQGFSW